MENSYGFVYIWYDSGKSKNHIDNRRRMYYIGAHWGSENDGYVCSSKWMKISYKRRPQDFSRRVLFRTFNYDELWLKEYEIISNISSFKFGKKYYNLIASLNRGRGTGKRTIHSEQTKKKISDANKGKIISEEHRKKLRVFNTGRTHSLSSEAREKISKVNKGKKRSEKFKENISKFQKERKRTPLSEETKRKISIANLGKTFSKEHKDALSKIRIGKFHSEETKEKMRQASLGNNYALKNKIEVLDHGQQAIDLIETLET